MEIHLFVGDKIENRSERHEEMLGRLLEQQQAFKEHPLDLNTMLAASPDRKLVAKKCVVWFPWSRSRPYVLKGMQRIDRICTPPQANNGA